MKPIVILIILLMTVCIVNEVYSKQEQSRTVYLSQEELAKLNSGKSVYRWYGEDKDYGEGNEFMDEVRPPQKVCMEDENYIYTL